MAPGNIPVRRITRYPKTHPLPGDRLLSDQADLRTHASQTEASATRHTESFNGETRRQVAPPANADLDGRVELVHNSHSDASLCGEYKPSVEVEHS